MIYRLVRQYALVWPLATVLAWSTLYLPAADTPPGPGAAPDPATAPITGATTLAEAGGHPVTVREVLLRAITVEGDDALKRLLTRKVVLLEAQKRNVQVARQDLEQILHDDLAAYRAELARVDPAQAKSLTDDQIIRSRFQVSLTTYRDRELYYALVLQRLATQGLDLSTAALAGWYEREKDRYGVPAQYQVRHILIRFFRDPEGNLVEKALQRDADRDRIAAAYARAEKKANQVRDLLQAGQSFEQMEKKYSEEEPDIRARGGALPPFTINSALDKNFLAAARSLKAGECSQPIRSAFGFHIILMDKIVPGQYPPFDTVQDRVRRDYLRREALLRAEPFVDTLSRSTEITHLGNLYLRDGEDLTADVPAATPNTVVATECVAVIGRVPESGLVDRASAVTRHEFYGELFRTAGRRFMDERVALELFMQSLKKTPGEPTEIEISRLFSNDQVRCYALQDQAAEQARLLNLPPPARRKFYDYMKDVTGRSPAELKEDARERAALWKFMQLNYPWTEDELTKAYYIEQEKYDVPGSLKISVLIVKPDSAPAKPGEPADTPWLAASARARELYARIKGGGLPLDTDTRLHPDAVSWEYAAKNLSDAPEALRATAGAWPAFKVLRMAKSAELSAVDGATSGFELTVLDCDPAIGREALGLTDRQVSAPVRSLDGFYLVRREAFTPPYARPLTDPEVHDQVERDFVSPRIRKNLQPVLDRLMKEHPATLQESVLQRLCAQ